MLKSSPDDFGVSQRLRTTVPPPKNPHEVKEHSLMCFIAGQKFPRGQNKKETMLTMSSVSSTVEK